jgi:DNA polymerase elongation subunit (family B)
VKKHNLKILAFDLETAPHTAHVWGLFKQTVSLSQLQETGRVLCFAWRWVGEKDPIQFISEREGRKDMLMKAHQLLSEADIVLSYNGKKFDLPTLNKEFLEAGLPPPAPYKQVDLYVTAKRQFRFASNKMDHLAKQLGIRTKVRHSGHELWVRCMAGDPKAWEKMERYNKRDVLILDKLYQRMLPWIVSHPNVTITQDDRKHVSCPTCGAERLQRRGVACTKTYTYARYQCTSCGSWSRSRLLDKSEAPPPKVVGIT